MMRAAVLEGLHRVAIREAPEPVIEKPHDVLLRVDAVGMCGSDIHYYTSGRIGSQIGRASCRERVSSVV